jgi:hypothetical protein
MRLGVRGCSGAKDSFVVRFEALIGRPLREKAEPLSDGRAAHLRQLPQLLGPTLR